MRKILPVLTALALTAFSLSGCSPSGAETQTSAASTAAGNETAGNETAENGNTDGETSGSENADSQNPGEESADENGAVSISVGALKGPTSMGLTAMLDGGGSENTYDFTMVTAADELVASVVTGKTDIALVPANVASVLYNKTEGGVSVIDINTLGVLYVVSPDTSITSVSDLKGKTLYLTGKGTTPDYAIRYLLKANGLQEGDVTLEYKSEATEVAAVLREKEGAIGLLPQPFVTVVLSQNPDLQIVLDLTKEWDSAQGEGGSRLVTGVTIVRREFLEENPAAVDAFLADHEASVKDVNADPETASRRIAEAGIVEKAEIAKAALPYCNITFIDGEEMKTALSGYLSVLWEQDPASVGGVLPGDDFYYGTAGAEEE